MKRPSVTDTIHKLARPEQSIHNQRMQGPLNGRTAVENRDSAGALKDRGVAQGKERTHPKRKAAGSSPAAPANFRKKFRSSAFNVRRVAIGVGESGDVEYMPVRQARLAGALGYLDRSRREIAIERQQPEVGKHLILLHEMCHAAAEDLKAEGIIERQPSEEFISCFAARLFGMLSFSDLWAGVTPDQSREFFASQEVTGTTDDELPPAAVEAMRAHIGDESDVAFIERKIAEAAGADATRASNEDGGR